MGEAPEPKVEEHTAWDEIEMANHIVLVRQYDVLVAILGSIDPDKAEALVKYHESGGLLSPPIVLRSGE